MDYPLAPVIVVGFTIVIIAAQKCTAYIAINYVVLHINKAKADTWELDEVIERWHTLYKGCTLSQRYLAGQTLLDVELEALKDIAEKWRKRLMKISWFMWRLNEKISRQANFEENCTGH